MIAVGTDDSLVLATDTQQLLYFTVSSLQHAKDSSGFENLYLSFHGPNVRGESAITGIDVALWKPIVATCGKDKTVRVWNPSDKKIDLMKEFDEEPTALSMHPSGIYIAVGFSDKIKILAVLLDDLCLCKEVTVRYCSLVKFSRGGHFIAAVNASNIQVFNTFTGAIICTLRGHNNKIRNLVWLNYDARLMSVGSEGAVFFWDIFPAARRNEQYQNPVPFLAGTCPSDGSRAFVVTSDRVVREVAFTKTIDPVTGLECSIKEPRDVDIGHVGSVAFLDPTRNILLLGTGDDDLPGAVLAMPAYSQLSSVFETTILHSAAVTAIAMTYDGALVCTADANGCIVLSEYEGMSAAGKVVSKAREGTGAASFEFHEEVAVHKADLEARKSLIAELAARVEELNLNNEHQMRLKEMEHNNKIKEISLKFTGQLRTETDKYDALFQEKSDTEDSYKARMAELHDKQQSSLRQIDIKYKTKLNAESNRHKLMLKETEEAHRRWNEENAALVESHQAYLSELSADYEDKLYSEQSMQKKLQSDRETIQVSFDGSRLYCEQDADIEITEMKIKYESRLRQEEELGVELMAQHALMKKDLQMLTRDADQQKEEIRRLREKETRLLENIRSLEKDIQSHKKDIREREETITDKEKRIFDLKKKNQELEKFRFVLDYKIKELKLQISPREHEIATMRKQIEEMELELEQYHKSNQALTLMISELKLKIDGLRRELESQEERVEMNARLTEKYKRDLQEIWEIKEDPHQLKAKVVVLYRVYVQEDLAAGGAEGGSGKADGEDPQQTYNRDREQMERNLDALRRALKTEALTHKRDVNKMMRENVILTKELNSLRKESKSYQQQTIAIEQAMKLGTKANFPELLDLLGIESKRPGTTQPAKKAAGEDEMEGKGASDELPAPPSAPPPKRKLQRSVALRTTSAEGRPSSRATPGTIGSRLDQWEAWREIEMQRVHMQQLENQVQALCYSLGLDPADFLAIGALGL